MNRPRIAIPEPSLLFEDYNRKNWPLYASAVEASSGEAVRIPLTATQDEIARILSTCQGTLLPGCHSDLNPARYGEDPAGSTPPDHAREAANELLLQDAFNLRKPLLCICYGFQAMNVWLGGSLIQNLPEPDGTAVAHSRIQGGLPPLHPVRLAEGSRMRRLASEEIVKVTSSHHQAVSRLGDGLQLIAVSPSDGVIEGAEMPTAPYVVGIQWHPERNFEDPFSQRIFADFIDAARTWQPTPNTVSPS